VFLRNFIFVLISIFFIFTYPFTVKQWSLNDAIGWHTTIGRPWLTYLLPIWFLLIFLLYHFDSIRHRTISSNFFWTHAVVTIVPTFFISYPFVTQKYLISKPILNPLAEINKINWSVRLYLTAQFIFLLVLLLKILKAKFR
jgi:hypothetical protein